MLDLKPEFLWKLVILILFANFLVWAYKNPSDPNPKTPTSCAALHNQVLYQRCEEQLHPPIGHPK